MSDKKWVAMYGNAMSIAEHRPESYAKNITLRYPIPVPFCGEALRFSFDNFCGEEPVTLSRASVALARKDKDPYKDLECEAQGAFYELDFGEDETEAVTIGPHQTIVSNPLQLHVEQGDILLVSFYFADFTKLESAVAISGRYSGGYFSIGDQTGQACLPVNQSKTTGWYYFLNNIDILTDAGCHAVICYGDSITAQDWPDECKALLKEKQVTDCAIIRRAASGTRVLRQYDCITYDSYGLKGKNRFLHELETAGADTLIIQQGINDIIHPVGEEINRFRPMSDLPTAEELIDGLRYYIKEARKTGEKIWMGTLLPIKGWRTYADFREDLRGQVNDWIRTTDEIDGFIDFDRALRDPEDQLAFLPEYDSGDHLHPSRKGYEVMAKQVIDAMRFV